MTQDDVRVAVMEVLREVQQVSGREWTDLPPDARPIGTLEGFDSLSAVEATVMVEEKLGCNMDRDSVFVADNGRRALTLQEISEQICKFFAQGGAK